MDEFYQDLSPMLFYESEPFDSIDYLYELKFDGIRALAYLDNDKTIIKNKRHKDVTNKYPELNNLHLNSNYRCIIDGEIIVMNNGVPDFYKIQKRSLLQDQLKIDLLSNRHPVTFVAFDIIYLKDDFITNLPLINRKKLLNETINESSHLIISKFIEEKGTLFYNLTKEKQLEGVVAKEKLSKYFLGKRSKVWLKFKIYEEEDLVICGYIIKENNTLDIIFGKYKDNNLIYAATINSSKNRELILEFEKKYPSKPLFEIKKENIIWLKPYLVGRVKYMMKSKLGGLRQAVFLGVRDDKFAMDTK